MSATSKRNRALAAGQEPVTGKDLYKPKKTSKKVSKKKASKKKAFSDKS